MTRTDSLAELIIGLERRALERWCRGDPSGFLEISAPDVVYFDPFIEKRIDGRNALAAHYEPLRGKIQADYFELTNPHVQWVDRATVLTYNFVSRRASGAEQRWNCTEVYRQDPEGWRIIQSHWSQTKHAGP